MIITLSRFRNLKKRNEILKMKKNANEKGQGVDKLNEKNKWCKDEKRNIYHLRSFFVPFSLASLILILHCVLSPHFVQCSAVLHYSRSCTTKFTSKLTCFTFGFCYCSCLPECFHLRRGGTVSFLECFTSHYNVPTITANRIEKIIYYLWDL